MDGLFRELFIDDYIIEEMKGLRKVVHRPEPKEVVFVFDKPWEGNTSAYVTIFQDGERLRMYYRASGHDPESGLPSAPETTCYAESRDGIHWERPALGLHSFNHNKATNIILTELGTHNFTPFKDTNPDCSEESRYKAVGGEMGGLYGFQSSDGIHWKLIRHHPIVTKGTFDSQNVAFWDSIDKVYRVYYRDFREGYRDIKMSVSEDFLHWSDPQWLSYEDAVPEHLYTNAIMRYYRAPQMLIGFPMRFVPDRRKGDHPVDGVSDSLLMISRDGIHWRRWSQAFLAPGPLAEQWVSRNNMIAWGLLETRTGWDGAAKELSFYSSEGYYTPKNCLRRFGLRLDGFVSVRGDRKGGWLLTKPIQCLGRRLFVNYATSAAGSLQVAVCDEAGKSLPGYGQEDCQLLFGDEVDAPVRWGDKVEINQPHAVRLRFHLNDADLFSFCLI
ncbi:MAG: hypothetical protein NZ959_06190 [Armatimonadetes bacterium]|nr:hypothetical protein [Armatimonadota bacterium]MDW8121633.1 hypothetical protein [Armatimonadota bacterium]